MSLASAQTPLPSILDSFNLQGERLDAAQISDRNVLVLAGPGAGKTRLLCAHAAWLASRNEGIVRMLTFSNKAASEMEVRVSQALAGYPKAARRVAASTLHSFGLQLLKSYGSKLGLPASIDVLNRSDVDELATKAARELSMSPATDFGGWLERVRRLGQDADPGMAATSEGQLLPYVEQKMKKEGFVDQGALITWATHLLRSFPMIRASVRHHDRFLLVDEAQDCDPAQLAFLEVLLGDDGQVHLFMVMDPDQSLYGWRDADPERVLSWARKYQPIEYQLTENYRCGAAISRLAKYVLAPDTDILGTPPFKLYRAHDRDDEARFVHTQVRDRVLNNLPYRRMAVLGRAGWRLETIRDWLLEQKVPLIGGVPTEWSERERRILLSLFALDEWQSQVEPGPHSSRFLHEVLDVEEERLKALEQQAIAAGRHPGDFLSGGEAQYWQTLTGLAEQRLNPIALVRAIGKEFPDS
jgi:DNA helicase-2/ATP-dependent DNA helicase PcrA